MYAINERHRRERDARRMAVVRSAGRRIRNRAMGAAWAGWRWKITDQKRLKNLAKKALLRVEHNEIARAALPWLAAARAKQEADAEAGRLQQAREDEVARHAAEVVRLRQAAEDEAARAVRLEQIQASLVSAQATEASDHQKALAQHGEEGQRALVQQREESQRALAQQGEEGQRALAQQRAEIEAKHTDLEAKQAEAQQIEARQRQEHLDAIEGRLQRRREAHIQTVMNKAGHTMRSRLMSGAWVGWRWKITEEKRVKNLAFKAILRVQHHEASRVVLPWLAAARAHRRENALKQAAEVEAARLKQMEEEQAARVKQIYEEQAALTEARAKQTELQLLSTMDSTMGERLGLAAEAEAARSKRLAEETQVRAKQMEEELHGQLRALSTTMDETLLERMKGQIKEIEGAQAEGIKGIDERLSTEVVQVFAEQLKALQVEEKERSDGMRIQWLEELEQLEVTLREEFVKVQVETEEVKQQLSESVSSHDVKKHVDEVRQHMERTLSESVEPKPAPQLVAQLRALAEQVDQQASQISKMQADEVARISGPQARAQEVEILGFSTKLKQLQSDVESLTPQLTSQLHEIVRTSSQPAAPVEVSAVGLAKVRTELREDLQALRLEKEKMAQQMAEASRNQKTLTESFGENKASIQSLYSTLAEVMETKAQALVIKQQQEELYANVDKVTGGLVTVNAQVSAYSIQMDRVRQDAVADCAKETARLRQDMQMLQEEVTGSFASDIRHIEAEVGRMGSPLGRADGLKSTVERLQTEFAGLQDAQDAMQSSAADAGSRLQTAETELEVMRALEGQSTIKQDAMDVRAEIGRVKDRAARLETKHEQTETQLTEMQGTFRVHTSKIGKNEQNIERLDSSLRAEVVSVQETASMAARQTEDGFARASNGRNALAVEIEAIQQALSEVRVSGSDLTGKLEFHELKASELKGEIDVLHTTTGKHADAHRRFEELHDNHATVHSKFEELHQEHVGAHTKFEGLHLEHATVHSKFEELHQEHATKHSRFEELHDNHATVHSKFEELHEEHVGAHANFEGLHLEHATVHSKFEELHQETTEAHSKFEELHQAKMAVLEEHKVAHAAHQVALDTLMDQHEANTGHISILEGRNSTSTSELATDVQMLAGEVGDLDGKLVQFEEMLKAKAEVIFY